MPPDMADGTFASGRYAKRKRTQVSYRMPELDVDDTDIEAEGEADTDQDESDDQSGSDTDQSNPDTESEPECESGSDAEYQGEGAPKKMHPMFKKQRYSKGVPSVVFRPAPKRKIFPFLELPAEVRNMIYGYALSDPAGLNFSALTRDKRRTIRRLGSSDMIDLANSGRILKRFYRNIRVVEEGSEDVPNIAPSTMVPSLLAVNKQIFEEASSYLYSNEFVFIDTLALYTFLLMLGPTGIQRLKKVRLFNWNNGRGAKAYGSACFALLVPAVNISDFSMDTGTAWYRSTATAAQRFYRDAYPWMEAVGRANGKPDAVVDALHVDYKEYDETRRGTAQVTTSEKKTKEFKVQLRKLLLEAVRKRKARMMKNGTYKK